MSARITWDGLDELKAALRRLPDDLRGEADRIAEDAANGATTAIKTIYGQHRVTGHLQNSTVVEQEQTGPFGVAYRVRVSDPIAWLFDNGSQARHWAGGKSTGRMWGKTPPTHAFVKTMIRFRRVMYPKMKTMLVRHGLSVTGEA